MKHRFSLDSLNHTIVVADISELGMAIEINPRTGNTKIVPALRFADWKEAEQYFRAKEVQLRYRRNDHRLRIRPLSFEVA